MYICRDFFLTNTYIQDLFSSGVEEWRESFFPFRKVRLSDVSPEWGKDDSSFSFWKPAGDKKADISMWRQS